MKMDMRMCDLCQVPSFSCNPVQTTGVWRVLTATASISRQWSSLTPQAARKQGVTEVCSSRITVIFPTMLSMSSIIYMTLWTADPQWKTHRARVKSLWGCAIQSCQGLASFNAPSFPNSDVRLSPSLACAPGFSVQNGYECKICYLDSRDLQSKTTDK